MRSPDRGCRRFGNRGAPDSHVGSKFEQDAAEDPAKSRGRSSPEIRLLDCRRHPWFNVDDNDGEGTGMSSSDRLAIVTGTSSGLGAAIAQALLADDWTVVGLSRRMPPFSAPAYRHIRIDLGDLAHLRSVAERELAPILSGQQWSRIGLVNNAGAIGAMRALDQADPLQLASVFAVNAVAPIFLCGFVIRTAPAATPLRIVNVSTGAAVQPIPGIGDYGSSKAALRLASMTLAAELASSERPGGVRPDVAILSYAPGVVDTAMQEAARANDRPWNKLFVDFHAQGRLVPPAAPARGVVQFLAGDAAQPFLERRYGER